MSLESDWLAQKERVKGFMVELLDLGLSIDAARTMAGWNPTLEYDNFSDLQYPNSVSATPGVGFSRDLLRIQFSRSEARANAGLLNGATIDAGKQYAVFMNDIPSLGITSVAWYLNGVHVHTEGSAPWDYAGTTGGGGSNRVTFAAGAHTIDAEVTDSGGTFSLSVTFLVE
jgi:hypothetical protein